MNVNEIETKYCMIKISKKKDKKMVQKRKRRAERSECRQMKLHVEKYKIDVN